jgi:predicted O-methyltransferase YrrM
VSIREAAKATIQRAANRLGYRIVRIARIEQERPAKDERISLRPLLPITADEEWRDAPNNIAGLEPFISASPAFKRVVVPYFNEYPENSFISAYSRAYLYGIVRALKPAAIVEVGTLYAGTTEVLARALWENGVGTVHTIDPFGAKRAPPVLANWPPELRAITNFEPVNSMSFFARARDIDLKFDLALIDGDHDLEFAFFDIQMAAKQLKRGGLIFVDNSEQLGPFHAARRFAAANPDWIVLGRPFLDYRSDAPFKERGPSSLSETNLIVLQAPKDIVIGDEPTSWGQAILPGSRVAGFALDVASADGGGHLNYRAILRAFGDQARRIEEFKTTGIVDIPGNASGPMSLTFDQPLKSEFPLMFPDSHHTVEFEMAWNSPGVLKLKDAPRPLS